MATGSPQPSPSPNPVPYNFQPNTTVYSAQVNSNFYKAYSDLTNAINVLNTTYVCPNCVDLSSFQNISGQKIFGSATDYLTTYAFGTNGTPTYNLSNIGAVGFSSASRTSGQSGSPGATSSVGGDFFGFNDKASGFSSWALYTDARAYNYVSLGPTQSIEADISSFQSSSTFDPYNAYQGKSGVPTMDLWLASGANCTVALPCYQPTGGTAASQDASLAIGIVNNAASFKRGIVFGFNALTGNDGKTLGQTAVALALPAGDMLQWNRCDNITSYPNNCSSDVSTSSIWSDSLNGTNTGDLVFTDSGPEFQPHSGISSTTVKLNPNTSLQVQNLTASSCVGTDSNKNLVSSNCSVSGTTTYLSPGITLSGSVPLQTSTINNTSAAAAQTFLSFSYSFTLSSTCSQGTQCEQVTVTLTSPTFPNTNFATACGSTVETSHTPYPALSQVTVSNAGGTQLTSVVQGELGGMATGTYTVIGWCRGN